jgi:hypothetical protein
MLVSNSGHTKHVHRERTIWVPKSFFRVSGYYIETHPLWNTGLLEMLSLRNSFWGVRVRACQTLCCASKLCAAPHFPARCQRLPNEHVERNNVRRHRVTYMCWYYTFNKAKIQVAKLQNHAHGGSPKTRGEQDYAMREAWGCELVGALDRGSTGLPALAARSCALSSSGLASGEKS